MIVKILGEGGYEVPGRDLEQLGYLDVRVRGAIDEGDADMFAAALNHLLTEIRRRGTPVSAGLTEPPHDVLLPAAGSPMAEGAATLGPRKLIPV